MKEKSKHSDAKSDSIDGDAKDGESDVNDGSTGRVSDEHGSKEGDEDTEDGRMVDDQLSAPLSSTEIVVGRLTKDKDDLSSSLMNELKIRMEQPRKDMEVLRKSHNKQTKDFKILNFLTKIHEHHELEASLCKCFQTIDLDVLFVV